MKKVLIIAMSFVALQACSNSDSVPAVQNDGIKTLDSNGGLADTVFQGNTAVTDTSKLENREDLSIRDTFGKQPKRPSQPH